MYEIKNGNQHWHPHSPGLSSALILTPLGLLSSSASVFFIRYSYFLKRNLAAVIKISDTFSLVLADVSMK